MPPFDLDQTRAVVRLPELSAGGDHQNTLSAGAWVLVSGWGVEKEDSDRPAVSLRKAKLRVVNHIVCRLLYATVSVISEHMMCAGSASGRDACSGDSGGPLVHTDPMNVTTQYGVVSFGRGCGHMYHPGVFTNLADKSIRLYVKTVSGI
ncbi:trypsin 5G1-like [Frankliniella occidentalis]|uniref:Trypsin 5G1-like n=1 Tax=Frankliniella occidentalis TaxID=133901 RepID=A0A9C6U6M3_FRAOC|nr:trypsin 5G1-like [Frankliniella occidentalis]